MSITDLQEKFPDCKPVTSAPWLSTINGIGLTLYGRRDYDEETHTYIKTWCICLVFVPIFALRAYRVADADVGWYFIGKEPLSILSKAWNLVVVLAIALGVSLGAWTSHTNSPGYKAGQQMTQAQEQQDAGQLADAARNYADVASGTTEYAAQADDRLKDLVDVQIEKAPVREAVGIIQAAISLHGPEGVNQSYPDLNNRALKLARQHQKDDPRSALGLLDAIQNTHKPGKQEIELRESILVSIVESDPDDLNAASELALIYESRGEDQACVDLLAPHADRLNDSEGARVLGQIYAFRGDFEPAYALLNTYTAVRLERLRQAEQAYDNALNRAWDKQIELLNQGAAPESFYNNYDKADEAKQGAMVDAYVQEQIKNDRAIANAIGKLMEESAVVPVALDLGMVMLGRASSMPDPDAKRAELEAAEQTFLAIRGIAGETDEYRMYLGQVYYWLGKADQGKELLDQLLAEHERKYEVLIAVAGTLREVGAVSEARAMVEEAYRKAEDTQSKYAAAGMRALMQRDRDDQIEWLKLANPDEAGIQAALNSSLGARAADYGNPQAAMQYIRKAIKIYEDQPESSTTLNNSALVYLRLFKLDGDPASLQGAVDRMDKAVTLEPSDSILMLNTASVHLQAASYDAVKDHIDLVALEDAPSLEMLPYLYDDINQKDLLSQQITSHPSMTKALGYAERLMLVAPQRAESYAAPLLVHRFNRNDAGLQELLDRVNNVQIDLTDTMSERMAFYEGKLDENKRDNYTGRINKWRDTVKQLRNNTDPVTFSYAVGSLIGVSLSGAEVGLTIDSNELVALAEEAFALSKSHGTRGTLRAALCLRAIQQLSAANPDFARFVTSYQRPLDATEIIAVALAPGHRFSNATAQHPDITRALSMLETHGQRYDNHWGAWHWAMLRSTRPDLADQAASSVMADEYERLTQELSLELYGNSAQRALSMIWRAQINGDNEAAKAIYQNTLDQKIPTPPINP